MLSYLAIWLSYFCDFIYFFDIVFIPHRKPVSLCWTIITSPNCPLPIFLPRLKSSLLNFFSPEEAEGTEEGDYLLGSITFVSDRLGSKTAVLAVLVGDLAPFKLIPNIFNKFSSVLPLELCSANKFFFLNIPLSGVIFY